MNKHRFRLIFSKVRGCLVPVPEIASSVSVDGRQDGNRPSITTPSVLFCSPTLLATIIASCFNVFTASVMAADILPDNAQANMAPQVGATANGTPLVNIATPDSQGLSHNRFTEFNVQTPGVVLNNSMTPGVSQIGGLAAQNPNLAANAKTILSEVTGKNASHIAGTLEVFGAKADVFIANPNGVTLNGVTTLNTGRLGVTTGHVAPDNHSLTFKVDDTSGRVVIGARGVDTHGLNYFDVVARGVTLNGSIGSADKHTDIQVVSGPVTWNATDQTLAHESGHSGGIAIDGSAAGSMYGHNVSLVATASGAGVNQQGAIHAAGDIHISANGDVSVEHLDAGHDISLNASAINAHVIQAGHDAALNAAGALTLENPTAQQGLLQAGHNIHINAQQLTNRGNIHATDDLNIALREGVDNHGDILAGHALHLTATHLNNQGKVQSGDSMDMALREGVDNQGNILSGGAIHLSANGTVNQSGGHISGQSTFVTAANVTNQNNSLLEGASHLDLKVSGDVQNKSGSALRGGLTELNAHTLHNEGGAINGQNIKMHAAQIDNSTGAHITATAGLELNSEDILNNTQGGRISADSLTLQTGSLTNDASHIDGRSTLFIKASELNNQQHGLLTGKDMTLNVENVNQNSTAGMKAEETLTFTGHGSVHNNGGSIEGQVLHVTTGQWLNHDGAVVKASDSLTLTADTLSNTAQSVMLGAHSLKLSLARSIENNHALLKGGDIDIQAVNMTNTASGELDGEQIDVNVTGNLLSDAQSKIHGSEALHLRAGQQMQLTNSALAAKNISLQGKDIAIAGATIKGTTLSAKADNTLSLANHADIALSGSADVQAHTFTAQDSTVKSGQDLSITTQDYTSTATLEAGHDGRLTLTGQQDLSVDATHQLIHSNGKLTVQAHNITVNTDVDNAGDIDLQASGKIDNHAAVISGKALTMTSQGDFINHAKTLLWSAGDMILHAVGTLLNDEGGMIMSGHNMVLQSQLAITNAAGGQIKATNDIVVHSPTLLNESKLAGEAHAVLGDRISGVHHYSNSARTDHYHVRVNSYGLANTLTTLEQGLIQAGHDLILNPELTEGQKASVQNHGGQVLVGHDIILKGDLQNVGQSKTLKVLDILKLAGASGDMHTTTSPSIALSPDRDTDYSSLFDMLDTLLSGHFHHGFGTFYDEYSDRIIRGLQSIDSQQGLFQQLMSAALGADWKAQSEAELDRRWAAFKAHPDSVTITAYSNKGAEFSAGHDYTQLLGSLQNGNAPAVVSDPRQVNIGNHHLTVPVGSIDASFSFHSAFNKDGSYDFGALQQQVNPSTVLDNLLHGNPLFTMAGSVAGATAHTPNDHFHSISPLYETRISYINQNEYYGSEYFFGLVGYDPSKAESVLGDAYFDHQLITSTIDQVAGNFFATHQHLSGTALVKQLMDDAATEAARLHLQVGHPLTAEQYNHLDHDIIWYEEQTVDGHTVLAPKVYLAKNTLKALDSNGQSDAQLTAGNNIHADITEGENGNAVIKAGGNVAIYSHGDFNNIATGGVGGGIEAGAHGRALIVAEGKVMNHGAEIHGGDVKVLGAEGVVVETDMQYAANGDEVSRHNGDISSTGAVNHGSPDNKQGATEQQGSAGSQTQTTGDGSTTHAPLPAFTPEDAKLFFATHDTSTPLSEDELGHVAIVSNKNVHISGAQVGGEHNDVTLKAGGNLVVDDVHKVHAERSSTSDTGVLSASSKETIKSSATSEGSEITAQQLHLDVGGSTTIQGSKLNAAQTQAVLRGGLDVKAGEDATHEETISRTTGFVASVDAGAGDYSASAEFNSATGSHTTSGQGGAPGAHAQIGVSTTEDTRTHNTVSHHNSQLNLGSGTVLVGGVADLGGADINAGSQLSAEERAKMTPEQLAQWKAEAPSLTLQAGRVEMTKAVDVDELSTHHSETFIGYSYEAHSSVADVATEQGKLVHAAGEGQSVDGAQTAVQAAAQATQLAFNEVGGASVTLGVKHTDQSSDTTTSSDHISQFGGNLNLVTTDGGITLNGVEANGGVLGLHAHGGDVSINAAKTTSSSHSTETHVNAGLTASAGAAPTGAGAGLSVGTDGSHDITDSHDVKYTSSHLNAAEIDISTDHNLNLNGATVKGDDVGLHVAGNVNEQSQQDSHTETHTHGEWNTGAGIALTTNGGVIPTGSGGGSGGRDWDNSKETKEQSGIEAVHHLHGHIGGNVDLTGAYILGGNDGNALTVDGHVVGHDLVDSHEKDGASGGGSGGISRDGLPQVNLNLARVEQIHRQETQRATFDVSGGQVTGGEQGGVNHDSEHMSHVDFDKHIAGNEAHVVIDAGFVKTRLEGHKPQPAGRHEGHSGTSEPEHHNVDTSVYEQNPHHEPVALSDITLTLDVGDGHSVPSGSPAKFKPPVRVNGKLGYLAGPTKPIHGEDIGSLSSKPVAHQTNRGIQEQESNKNELKPVITVVSARKMNDEENVFYRADTRPPHIIAEEGFKTKLSWSDSYYGDSNVNASKNLPGVINFVDSIKNSKAPGGAKLPKELIKGTWNEGENFFIYKIHAEGLGVHDVTKEIGAHSTSTYIDTSKENVDVNSFHYKRFQALFDGLSPFEKDSPLRIHTVSEKADKNTKDYLKSAAAVQQVMIKGPISPERIDYYGEVVKGKKKNTAKKIKNM